MKPLEEILKTPIQGQVIDQGVEGFALRVRGPRKSYLQIVASWGMGWDHVSVSRRTRTPSWEEMMFIKDLFFSDEETVIQYHPKKSNYVNVHPYVLHMWRPHDVEILMPPIFMV